MIEQFRLGFANRTLGYRLPDKNRKAGAEMRGPLAAARHPCAKAATSTSTGRMVIPVFDLAGNVTEMYGRKITPGLREGTPLHLYLPGPHRGVWNEEALQASKEIILCESLIDALTFWCAGFRNVTASYGVNGFTDDHRAAFQQARHPASAGSPTTATKPARKRRWRCRRTAGDGHRVLPRAVSARAWTPTNTR